MPHATALCSGINFDKNEPLVIALTNVTENHIRRTFYTHFSESMRRRSDGVKQTFTRVTSIRKSGQLPNRLGAQSGWKKRAGSDERHWSVCQILFPSPLTFLPHLRTLGSHPIDGTTLTMPPEQQKWRCSFLGCPCRTVVGVFGWKGRISMLLNWWRTTHSTRTCSICLL